MFFIAVSLTKTDKKGLALKQQIVEDVKRCVEKYKSIYVFSVDNMRNVLMKELRQEWKPSRFFFGKNKVIALGLGRTPEEEIADNLHQLANCLKGQCGLLFTDETKDTVVKWFEDYSVGEYARSGFKATSNITIPAGPCKQFSHAIEPYLRQLGLPTSLERGVVTLLKDYEVCKEGTVLTPEQAKILKLYEHKLADFKLILKAVWDKENGFEKLVDTTGENMDTEDGNDEDED